MPPHITRIQHADDVRVCSQRAVAASRHTAVVPSRAAPDNRSGLFAIPRQIAGKPTGSATLRRQARMIPTKLRPDTPVLSLLKDESALAGHLANTSKHSDFPHKEPT